MLNFLSLASRLTFLAVLFVEVPRKEEPSLWPENAGPLAVIPTVIVMETVQTGQPNDFEIKV